MQAAHEGLWDSLAIAIGYIHVRNTWLKYLNYWYWARSVWCALNKVMLVSLLSRVTVCFWKMSVYKESEIACNWFCNTEYATSELWILRRIFLSGKGTLHMKHSTIFSINLQRDEKFWPLPTKCTLFILHARLIILI